jgi:hypothetical protein
VAKTIREAAWSRLGIEYDPESRLAGAARERSLGAPVTAEFEHEGYRVHGFVNGIVFYKIDDGEQIEVVDW